MSFSVALSVSLNGRNLTVGQLNELQSAIADCVRGSSANFISVGRLNAVLTSGKISPADVKRIGARLQTVCEEVRGPDDTSLRPALLPLPPSRK
jgi:hypothetical protein